MEQAQQDEEFMHVALSYAEHAGKHGDYPIGAILAVNGMEVGGVTNKLVGRKNWSDHAETLLLREQSTTIREAVGRDARVVLYSTLEPCLMCLGTAILHRVTEIVYACPDPHGGACNLKPTQLPDWYKRHWPNVRGNVLARESYELIVPFLRSHPVENNTMLALFEEMRKSW